MVLPTFQLHFMGTWLASLLPQSYALSSNTNSGTKIRMKSISTPTTTEDEHLLLEDYYITSKSYLILI
jgi:hypothetical protein